MGFSSRGDIPAEPHRLGFNLKHGMSTAGATALGRVIVVEIGDRLQIIRRRTPPQLKFRCHLSRHTFASLAGARRKCGLISQR